MHTHPEQWVVNAAAPGEQLGVRCLAQGSHLSRGQCLPEPRFEPTTSDALSIRPWLPINVYKTSWVPGSITSEAYLSQVTKMSVPAHFLIQHYEVILDWLYTVLRWHLKIGFIHLPNPFILFKLQINLDLINLISWENYCTRWRFLNLHNLIKHFL